MKKFAFLLVAIFLAAHCFSQVVFRDTITDLYGVHNYNKGSRYEFIPAKYDFVQRSSDSIFLVMKDKKFGVVSQYDSLLIPFEYDAVLGILGDYVSVRKDDLYGLCLLDGLELIPCKYNTPINIIQLRKRGLVMVKTSTGKNIVLTDSGTQLANMEFDSWIDVYQLSRGDELVEVSNDRYGVISKYGVVVPFEYDHISRLRDGNRHYKYRKEPNDSYGLMGSKGKILTDPIYGQIKTLKYGDFSLFTVKSIEEARKDSAGNICGQFGVIDRNGELVVPCEYLEIATHRHGFEVRGNKGVGILDKSGQVRIPAKYTKIKYYDGTFAAVKSFQLYGFVDGHGNELVKPKYEKVKAVKGNVVLVRLKSGYAVVTKSGELVEQGPLSMKASRRGFRSSQYLQLVSTAGKRGLIDTAGNKILSVRYSAIRKSGNHFIVTKGSLKGAYDLQGTPEVPIVYKYVSLCDSGYVVGNDSLAGIVNFKGDTLMPLMYDKIEGNGPSFIVSKDGKQGVLNLNGTEVIPLNYRSIKSHGSMYASHNFDGAGLLDSTGKILLPFTFSSLESTGTPNFLIARDIANYGIVSTSGDTVLPIIYDRIRVGSCYASGQDPLKDRDVIATSCLIVRKGNRYAIFTLSGVQVTEFKYTTTTDDRNGISALSIGSKQFVVNLDGEEFRYIRPYRHYD